MTQRDKHTTQKKTGHRLWRTVYLFSLPIYLLNEKSGQCMKGSVKKTKKTQHEGQRYQNKKKKQDKDFRGQYFCPPTERQKNLAPWAVDADVAEQVFFFFFLKKFFPLFSTALRPCAVDAGVAKGVFFVFFCLFFCRILP